VHKRFIAAKLSAVFCRELSQFSSILQNTVPILQKIIETPLDNHFRE
jgi:hypothetical protein